MDLKYSIRIKMVMSTNKIHETLNQAEIQEIKDRVYLLEDDTIIFKSLKYRSYEASKIMFDKLLELTSNFEFFYAIVDTREVIERGDANYRKYIISELQKLPIQFICFIIDRNSLFRIVLKFVMSHVVDIPFKLQNNMERAKDEIQKYRNYVESH